MPNIWIGAAANALNYSMEIAMRKLLDQRKMKALQLFPLCELDLTVREYTEVTALIHEDKLDGLGVQGVCLVRDSRGKRRERPEFAVVGTVAVEGQQLLRLLRSPRPDELPTMEELQKLTLRQFRARYRQSVQAARAAATPVQANAQEAVRSVQATEALPEQEAETETLPLLDLEQGA